MSSSDWLKRLPSVNDILDKPPLRGVVERLNRTSTAARVKSFLEEIREEIQARTGEISLTELAERAARYVLGPGSRGSGAAINATGQLWGEPWVETPIAEAAIERAMLAARDFTREIHAPNEAERLACELSGAEAAFFLSSRLGAIELTLRALVAEGSAIVARGEVGQISPDCRLTDLATLCGARLREVGAINETTVEDFAGALHDAAAMVVRIEPEDFLIVGQSTRPTLADLARLANEKDLPFVVDLGRNPLIEGLPTDGREVTSAKQSLADGANLVILRTDGFLGGPPGALLLGRKEFVERVKQQPLAGGHRPNGMTVAALAATLDLCRESDQARFTVPLLSLLDTPLDNLRTRAERLAPQMVGQEIASAEMVSLSESVHALPRSCRLPSWGISLRPQTGDVTKLAERLQQAVNPLVGRVEREALLLDLRTVFPRQDIDLVNSVTGE